MSTSASVSEMRRLIRRLNHVISQALATEDHVSDELLDAVADLSQMTAKLQVLERLDSALEAKRRQI